MTWRPYGEMTPLLKAFTKDKGGSLLALHCFLLIAEEPRTMAELCDLTGSTNGPVNRAVRSMTPWFNPEIGEVVKPRLHLIQRRRILCGRGHRLYVTAAGRKLLEG